MNFIEKEFESFTQEQIEAIEAHFGGRPISELTETYGMSLSELAKAIEQNQIDAEKSERENQLRLERAEERAIEKENFRKLSAEKFKTIAKSRFSRQISLQMKAILNGFIRKSEMNFY